MSSAFSNIQEEEMEYEEAQMHVESARPLKKLRLRGQESQPLHPLSNSSPSSAGPSVRNDARPVSSQDGIVDKGKQSVSPQVSLRGRRHISERASQTVDQGKFLLPDNQMPHTHAMIIPKDEPIDELPDYELPISVIPPQPGIQ